MRLCRKDIDCTTACNQLGVRPVDHADEPFQPGLQQAPAQRFVAAEIEQEARKPGIMAEPLIAVAVGRPHALDLHLSVPVGRRRDRAGVGAKADQSSFRTEALAAELANIQLFANHAHFRCSARRRYV